MRRTLAGLLLAAGVALIAPVVADAQVCQWNGFCESYLWADGSSVYGYSRSVEYFGNFVAAEATLDDPNRIVLTSDRAQGQYDAQAVVACNALLTGNYELFGEHYYWDYYWQDYVWDGSTWDVAYAEVPNPQIYYVNPGGPWMAGSLVDNVEVHGSGFSWQQVWACGGADGDTLSVSDDTLITGTIQVSAWPNEGVYICVGGAQSGKIDVYNPNP